MDDEIVEEEVVEEAPAGETYPSSGYVFFNYTYDQNWEGEIRVYYSVTQSASGNYSDVYIQDIEYRSNVNGEGWGRSANWTVYGTVGIEGSDSSTKNFNYFGESFYTYGDTNWVELGNGRSGTLRVYHRSDGTAEFDVYLCPVNTYNDFNVFHPWGGTYNCEITGWSHITTPLPTIVQSAPTIDLSVSVTDLGAATLTAYASVDCSSWQYKVDNGSWTNISGTGTSKSVSLTGMTGSHTYQVRATNPSNYMTGYSNTVTKTTDTSAPTISLSVSVTDLGAATLSASSNAACGSWQYQVDGGSWTSVSGTGTSKTINLTGMTGTHSYRVRATKSSNNVTGYSSTVTRSTDTDAPEIVLSASVDGLGNATLTAQADASCSSWQYQVDGTGSWYGISGTGSYKSTTVSGMTGTHTFQVRATKTSNNVVGYSNIETTTSDQSAPTITLSVSVTDLGVATLTATSNVSCDNWAYQTDGGSWGSISTEAGLSVTKTLNGMTGTHTYRVKANKTSNNVTGYSSTITKSTDTAAPTITLTATVDGHGNATLSATADASCGSWAYQVDGAGNWNTISGTGTSKSVTVPGMTGTHTFQVRATKTSNNVTGYSQVKSTTSDQDAPTITVTASVNSSGTVTLSASANVSCTGWAYMIDNGSWNSVTGTASSKTFTISGMTGAHSFQVKATKVSNDAVGYSSTVSTTTPTLALNKTSVNTNSSLTITVRYLPANTKVLLKCGSTQLSYYQYSSYQNTKTITLSSSDLTSLFNDSGVTTQQSISITVSVNGYSYTETRFTLSTGSNMNPTVGTPTATIVQGPSVHSDLASVYIAGFSYVKISAVVTPGSGASIAQHGVWLSYGTKSVEMENTSGNTWEATTTGPITGNTTFTVTATDTRGLTGSASYSLTGVKSWTAPVITFDTNYTYRCDSSGTREEGGPCVRVKVNVQYTTGISGNAIRNLYFYIQEDGSSTTHNLTSGTQSAAYALASPRPNQTITVVVRCRDKVGGYVSRELQLQGGHRDFALANYYASLAGGNLTALGIGMAPDLGIDAAAYGDTIQLPARGRFTAGGFELQNFIGVNTHNEISYTTRWEKNLLACDTSNPFAEDNETIEFYIASSDLANWTNIPSAVTGTFEGTRFVAFGFDNVYVVILEYTPVAGRIWVNVGRKSLNSQSITWNGWKGHTPDIT